MNLRDAVAQSAAKAWWVHRTMHRWTGDPGSFQGRTHTWDCLGCEWAGDIEAAGPHQFSMVADAVLSDLAAAGYMVVKLEQVGEMQHDMYRSHWFWNDEWRADRADPPGPPGRPTRPVYRILPERETTG